MANKKKNNQMLVIGVIIVAALFLFKGGIPGAQVVSGVTDVKRYVCVEGIPEPNACFGSGTPTVYSGQDFDVLVYVTTSIGDKAITIHEEAPFTIVGDSDNIKEYGLLDQDQLEDSERVYQLNPSQTGAYSFTGKYSVNGGVDQVISGVSSFNAVSCSPSAELCNNADDDCDYVVDEDLSQSCYTGPQGTEGVGICQTGTQTCSAGAWSGCSGQVIPTTEICGNGIDEDCNGDDLASNTKADTNCDQNVDWVEINNAVGEWLNAVYTWTEINNMIFVWLS